MRETRLTRRARAALAYYAKVGCAIEWHPRPFAFVTIERSGRRFVCEDLWEKTQPVTERMRELVQWEPTP
jgi:hypothetical protein